MMHHSFWPSLVIVSMLAMPASIVAASEATPPPRVMTLASASDTEGQEQPRPSEPCQSSQKESPAQSTEEAASRARDEHNGRVLSVKLEHGQDGPYYRVKLLEQGRVRSVEIDAEDPQ